MNWSLSYFAHGNSCAVMAYAKIGCDVLPRNGMTLKQIFHWIWIVIEKLLVKWGPVSDDDYDIEA